MRKIMRLPILWMLCTVLFLFSCKKELKESSITVPGNETLAGIPIPPLDWENIDFMPMPAGTFTVGVPWASGVSDQITTELLDDYESVDGWRLMYNTFNTTSLPDNFYFVLYNAYRGVIRLYYYVPPTANYQFSDNITHTLLLEKSYSANSPMMNFAGQDIVDVAIKRMFASNIEEAQLAPSTWYAMEFELAYDKNMSTQNFTSFAFDWTAKSIDVTSIALNGTQTGSIKGSITIPGTNFTISPSLSVTTNSGNVTMGGKSTADKLLPSLGSSIVNGIKSGITNGLSGLVSNFISGIFKRKGATNEENVHLKMDTRINLQGTLTNSFLITSPKLAIPGYNQTSTTGYIPDYNSPLGVFYLSAKPVVKVRKTHHSTGEIETSYTNVLFQLDNTTYQIDYNPAVTGIAQIQNVRREVVLYDNLPFIGTLSTDGLVETVGNRNLLTNVSFYDAEFGRITGGGTTLPFNVGVRISFDVVPNNGAAPVTITHTFAPTLVAF